MFRNRNRRVAVIALGTLTTVALAFQNCGQIKPSQKALLSQASIEARMSHDKDVMSRLAQMPSLRAWISAAKSKSQVTSGSISSVTSITSDGLTLTSQGFSAGPVSASSNLVGKKAFKFPANSGLGTSITSDTLQASAYTVVALFDGFPAGQIVTIGNGSADNQGMTLSMANGIVTAIHSSSTGNRSSVSAKVDKANGPIVIAVSFGAEPGDISLMVDGQNIADTSVVGSPASFTNTQRQLVLGATATSVLKVAELVLFTEALSADELNTLSRSIAESWGYYGVLYTPPESPDIGTGPVPSPTPTGVSGSDLYIINCSGCHGALAVSSKHGKTKAQIDAAISTISAMADLGVLTSEERQKISDALK